MGFNKRYVDSKNTIKALENDNLKGYYGKSDALIFEDNISSDVYSLFKQGISDKEILTIIKKRMEEKTYEVY
jgi:hypothetical protein